MSDTDYKVPYTTILEIKPHEKADRLEIAVVYGFQVIVKKDQYKVGDKVVYVPIDSVLPQWLEDRLFPADAKVKLHNHRIRQIRIRGLASQGMLIDPSDIYEFDSMPDQLALEENYAEFLDITKYDPPQPGFAQTQGKDKQRNKSYEHPLFHKYNGLDNIKWFPSLFKPGELVVYQEKLHGTNARASKLPFQANTLWKKVLKLLRLAPKVEKCYGSNNVQKSAARGHKGFYDEDIWGNTFKSIDVFNKLQVGETVFGEIIGPGIQKNYDYGLKEPRFVLFDVKILLTDGKQKWLDPDEAMLFARQRGFEFVPVLFRGPHDPEWAYRQTKGPSEYCSSQKVREGIVIKAAENYDVEGNKKALKYVSEEYLDDKSNTDFH